MQKDSYASNLSLHTNFDKSIWFVNAKSNIYVISDACYINEDSEYSWLCMWISNHDIMNSMIIIYSNQINVKLELYCCRKIRYWWVTISVFPVLKDEPIKSSLEYKDINFSDWQEYWKLIQRTLPLCGGESDFKEYFNWRKHEMKHEMN